MKALMAVLAASCLMLSGCEEGDETTINEAPDIIVGSNSQVIVVQDNSGLVSVDQTIGETGDDPSIYVSGNTGRVYVTTRPYTPPEPEEP
jgi:hypothetical protein